MYIYVYSYRKEYIKVKLQTELWGLIVTTVVRVYGSQYMPIIVQMFVNKLDLPNVVTLS